MSRQVGLRLALAAALLWAPAACRGEEPPQGGGGGPAITAEGQAPLPTRLTGEQLAFAQAYGRLPWAVVHLGAGDWGQALRDLTFVQDRIVGLKYSERLVGRPREAIAELQPATDRLALAIQRRETDAIKRAIDLTAAYSRVAAELSDAGWLSAGVPPTPAR